MRGVRNKDLEHTELGGFLNFDLKDILATIGEPAISSTWICRNIECVGKHAERLFELSETGESITGSELDRILDGINQTIDGQFEASQAGKANPWLIVEAVDSSYFEVFTDDAFVLDKLRSRFREVSQVSTDAA